MTQIRGYNTQFLL